MSAFRDRRPVRNVLAGGAAALTMLVTAGTAHADITDEEIREITDEYLFEASLQEFVDIRAARPYDERLDWSSDACSLSPDEPLGYEFTSSCYRHDFGYRNYELQGRFTEAARLRIDDNFRADMYSVCDDDVLCETVANVYYFAVRQFGGISTSVPEALDKAQVTVEKAPSGEVVSLEATAQNGERVQFAPHE